MLMEGGQQPPQVPNSSHAATPAVVTMPTPQLPYPQPNMAKAQGGGRTGLPWAVEGGSSSSSSASMQQRRGYYEPPPPHVGMPGISAMPSQYQYASQGPDTESSSPHVLQQQQFATLPSYQSLPHWGPGVQWPNQHQHPDGHLHPLPHPYPQQGADQWQASSQQLPPSASDVHQPPQQPLVRGSSGSHHPGAQLEKPSGGAGSYALQHTGRESHQAFRDVNLGPAAQSGPVTLSPSPTSLAIAPKTEDRDDAGLGDHLQVLLDSPDGDGTDSSQMGDQSMNEGFGTGAEWLKWTELDPEEETIANCWTELIDVESGEEQTLFQTTRFEPLAPSTLKLKDQPTDQQPSGGQHPESPGPSSATATAAAAVKTRLRWTPELHEKFVTAVGQLGGADRATPKAVLRVMGVQGITIYHVKSHLQKYRLAKYMPEISEARAERRRNDTFLSPMGINSSHQITQALQMQMEVQKRLHEQLEIQRELQLRIEAQGKSLQKMIEQQAKVGGVVLGYSSEPHEPSPSAIVPATEGPETPGPLSKISISGSKGSLPASIMESAISATDGAPLPIHIIDQPDSNQSLLSAPKAVSEEQPPPVLIALNVEPSSKRARTDIEPQVSDSRQVPVSVASDAQRYGASAAEDNVQQAAVLEMSPDMVKQHLTCPAAEAWAAAEGQHTCSFVQCSPQQAHTACAQPQPGSITQKPVRASG
ncbi:unnamed protein product [Sphagnum jensenii]|uniref:HTH myb-type domain-containing protein n=1 Tax=Sphagnum jensenii TaxID=128206 RepID=A0ABP1BQF9_9BRYO